MNIDTKKIGEKIIRDNRPANVVVTAVITAVMTILFAAFAALTHGSPSADNNPQSVGSTQLNVGSGLVMSGVYGNPALVGLDVRPWRALSLAPVSVSLWSDRFAPPLNSELFRGIGNDDMLARYLSTFLEKSFDLDNITDPDEVSAALTDALRGNTMSLFAGVTVSPFSFAARGFGIDVKTYADVDIRLPGGILLPFVSATDGLVAGSVIDLSDLRAEAIWASELGIRLGFGLTVPFMRDLLGLDRAALGAGVKLIVGHSYFLAEAQEGSHFRYDEDENRYIADVNVDIVTVGSGLHGNYDFDRNLFWGDNAISGQGWGLDLGAAFHNDNHFLSIDVRDFGMIFWDGRQVQRGTATLDANFDLDDGLGESFSELFSISDLEVDHKHLLTWLPMSLNLGYTYHYDVRGGLNALIGYTTLSAAVRQQLILGPARGTYMPRLSAGAGLGMLAGFLPVRYGLIVGGSEELGSALGVGLDLKYFSIDASYKAVGTAHLMPDRGFEVAAALTFRWRWRAPARYVRAVVEEEPEPVEWIPPSPEVPELPPLEDFPEPVEVIMQPLDPVVTPEPEPVFVPEPEPVYEEPPPPTPVEEEAFNASARAINFRSGGADLTPGSFAALNEIASHMIRHPNIRYEIQGHTDAQGGAQHNQMLSVQRAAAVRNFLVSAGVPADNVVAIGYGLSIPIADNNTAAGRALNRRVVLVDIPSQERYEQLRSVEREAMQNLEIWLRGRGR